MTDTLFLCRYCAQGYEEKNKVPFHECDPCDYCGALATNHPGWVGLEGHVIARHLVGAPRALTPQERDEQKRLVPTPNPDAPSPLPADYEVRQAASVQLNVTAPGVAGILTPESDPPTVVGVDQASGPSETKTAILSLGPDGMRIESVESHDHEKPSESPKTEPSPPPEPITKPAPAKPQGPRGKAR